MEKARISKQGKGWQLEFENNKVMSINWINIPENWSGSEILVLRDKGQPVLLKKGNEELKKSHIQNQGNANEGKNPNSSYEQQNKLKGNYSAKISQEMNYANSPYNFIPLNETVVYPDDQQPVLDKYDSKKNTGYIDLTITTKTELMVSKGADVNKVHDFLKIGKDNKTIIPGSTIRGLIRSLVGTLSYSELKEGEHYENTPMFYRGIFGNDFKATYREGFVNANDYYDYKALAGYLGKKGDTYYIIPAQNIKETQYYKISERNNVGKAISPKLDGNNEPVFEFGGKKFDRYDNRKIYFKPEKRVVHKDHYTKFYDKITGKEITKENPLKYARVTDYTFTTTNGFTEGTLIITGGIQRKKHDQWIVNLPGKDAIKKEVPKKIIEEYEQDINREEHFDLLINLKNEKKIIELNEEKVIPCFYLMDENQKIKSFGHTPLYRIKHTQSFSDAVHQKTEDGKFDLETLIFGNKDKFAGRVFFEDAIITDANDAQLPATLLKILASPKPTSSQFCLEQKNPLKLKNWSSEDIKTAGPKGYWNKKVTQSYWELPNGLDAPKSDKALPGSIKPVKPNNNFTGKIRFENLTDTELGALLFALKLPPHHYHKIGMAKPYGFGTIEIKPELILDDRKERYATLFDENNNWYLPIKTDKTIKSLIKVFNDFMLVKIGGDKDDKYDLWETRIISRLKAMLFFDENIYGTQEWLKETNYMRVKEFSPRKPLDDPKNIVSKHTTKIK